MAIKIESIVRFAGLPIGVQVSLPHGLVNPPRALVPDVVVPNEGGFEVTADNINITVTRLADTSPDAVDVWASAWHTMRREFGASTPPPGILPDGSLVPQPFVINQGVSSAGQAAVSAKIRATVAQAFPAGLPGAILAFNATDYDFGGIVNLALNRFDISVSGRYAVTAKYGTVTPIANHTQRLSLAINGFIVEATETLTATLGFNITTEFASDFNLNAGDFLEVVGFTNNASSTEITGNLEPIFAIQSLF